MVKIRHFAFLVVGIIIISLMPGCGGSGGGKSKTSTSAGGTISINQVVQASKQVFLISPMLNITIPTTTDMEGKFTFNSIQPGKYYLSFTNELGTITVPELGEKEPRSVPVGTYTDFSINLDQNSLPPPMPESEVIK